MIDRIALLERLQRLRAEGAIDDDEFAREKMRLLDDAPHRTRIWQIVLCILVAIAAAILLAALWTPRQDQMPRVALAPKPTVSPTTLLSPTSTPTHVALWGCDGWFNNVEFSDESGDGSGVEVQIKGGQLIKFNSWEGGVLEGKPSNTRNNVNSLTAKIRFAEFPDQSSLVSFSCRDGSLRIVSDSFGSAALRIGKVKL